MTGLHPFDSLLDYPFLEVLMLEALCWTGTMFVLYGLAYVGLKLYLKTAPIYVRNAVAERMIEHLDELVAKE